MKLMPLSKVLGFGTTLVALAMLSCEKEDLPPKQLSAAFQIRESASHPNFYDEETYDTDSVSTFMVSFLAEEPQADTLLYQWQLGSDSRTFTGKNLTLRFGINVEDSITVRLMVSRWNKDYTTQLESRSSSRTFYPNRKSLALGAFEGYFDDRRSQKVMLKIQDEFKHPIYNTCYCDDYVGLLISTDMPGRDTLFVSNGEDRHYVFHRKIPLLDGVVIHFSQYTFNRWIEDPAGEIYVDPKTKVMTMNLKARDIATQKEVTVKFTGKKIL